MSIAAILDTNVIVQALIGSPRAASSRMLAAYAQKRFRLIFSFATFEELDAVLKLPAIRARHGFADEKLRGYMAFLLANSSIHSASESTIAASITRDITDTKFLALAQQSNADFLVTNDRRHLLPVREFGPTKIVTPAHFLRKLP
jgi:putative PIN family toxin of toxin-antitoxin system